ncbi:MAG TPA: ferredoxin [Treponema sp.]|nr:ferredoxin [Treponema sp.]
MAEIRIDSRENLLKALRATGAYLPAICGGRGSCGKCAVRVISGSVPVSDSDRARFSPAELEDGWRLACAAFPVSEIVVEIPESGERQFSAVSGFAETKTEINANAAQWGEEFVLKKNPASFARQVTGAAGGGETKRELALAELNEVSKLAHAQGEIYKSAAQTDNFYIYRDRGKIIHIGGKTDPLYGVAVDIGTTTLGFALVELRTGKIAARCSSVNRQREMGGDVISRIQSANNGNLLALSGIARAQIDEGIAALCAEAGTRSRDIYKLAITGNTTMLHLLLNLSCHTLGQAPFTPVTLDMVFARYGEIFSGDLSCEVAILPGISTYVGADITAGLFFTGLREHKAPAVLVDIGTNGEMALAYNGKILCTATAAGPAFEGGNILWGTGSVPGAISGVRFHNGAFETRTIGDKPPAGICGTGVIDTVYEGLRAGLILPSGRFTKTEPPNELFLAKNQDGRDIVFCQKDIRELQLAKSAIRSGLDALLNHAGLGYNDIHTLYIAGGFGFNLNMESAAGVGLIPAPLVPKTNLAGNCALGGAVKYLLNGRVSAYDETLREIVECAEEFNLPDDKYFNEHFIDNINFDNWE